MESFVPYEIDASQIKGKTRGVFLPKNVLEVRDFVLKSLRVVIRGGGSGFVGGAIPLNGVDAVIDLSKLDLIENLDLERKTVEVEAGVILSDLQEFLKKRMLEFPIDIESREIATIGGMIATNAFGSRVLKYKRMENWVKWIEVVDCHGNISRKGATELSDYAGLEGISGIIVRACLKLQNAMKRSASLIKSQDIEKLVEAISRLKIDQKVCGIDFLDKMSSEFLGLEKNYHLIVEYENEDGKLKDKEYTDLMNLKTKTYYHLFSKGYTLVEDFKILIDRIPRFSKWLEARGIPYFGNFSIGVVHPFLNAEGEKYLLEMIKFVQSLAGQNCPKHGFGILKKEFVGSIEKKVLENVKKRTDPLNKFNVGKLI